MLLFSLNYFPTYSRFENGCVSGHCLCLISLSIVTFLAFVLNNSKVLEYLEFIYHRELEINETSKTIISSSYFDLYLNIDNGKLTSILNFTANGMASVFPQLIFGYWATIFLLL